MEFTRLIQDTGNFGSAKDSVAPDLVTPTIKTDMYTTGRGGQGNMAKNHKDKPHLARESQDVTPNPRRYSQGESHFGRGTTYSFLPGVPCADANTEVMQAARQTPST